MKISTSNKTVVGEIAPLYGLKPMEANFLLNFDPVHRDNEDMATLRGQMIDKLFGKGFVDFDHEDWRWYCYTYRLTDLAHKFIRAVEARKETRVMLKHGCDLFPELANI